MISTTTYDGEASMPLRKIFQPSTSSKGDQLLAATPPKDPNKSSKKKSALGVATFALSVAKESSNAFPPLQSVMSGLTFLLDNHQVGRWDFPVNL